MQADAFATWRVPFRKSEWVVYSKPPFDGPESVLAYLSRYTHRVAISNHRLVSADADMVAFRWKDYRVKSGNRQKVMDLATLEFIRRFLMPVLSDGFQQASGTRAYWPAALAKYTSPNAVRCSSSSHWNRRAHRKRSQRLPRSRCVNHAPVAAGSCASLRFSAAGKNRCRAHRYGSRPHDIQSVCQSSQT